MKPTRRSFLKWLTAAPIVAPVIAKEIDRKGVELTSIAHPLIDTKPKYEHKTYGTGFTIDTEGMTHSEALAAIDSRITGAESNFNRDTDSYLYAIGPSGQSKLHEIFQEEYKDYE